MNAYTKILSSNAKKQDVAGTKKLCAKKREFQLPTGAKSTDVGECTLKTNDFVLEGGVSWSYWVLGKDTSLFRRKISSLEAVGGT